MGRDASDALGSPELAGSFVNAKGLKKLAPRVGDAGVR